MLSTTTLNQQLLFEPSFDPCQFSLDNTFNTLYSARYCQSQVLLLRSGIYSLQKTDSRTKRVKRKVNEISAPNTFSLSKMYLDMSTFVKYCSQKEMHPFLHPILVKSQDFYSYAGDGSDDDDFKDPFNYRPLVRKEDCW